jgi:Raf kinase inhibitor-like YbhB/YbcL family protein
MRSGAAALLGLSVVAGCGGHEGASVPRSSAPATITVTSAAFADGATIPVRFTCRGAGGVPPLHWTGVPGEAQSVALVVSDPDAPGGTFLHRVAYDLPGGDVELRDGRLPPGAQEAQNSAGRSGWSPPCPPSGTHHYLFTVYALRGHVAGVSNAEVLDAIARQAIAKGQLTGTVTPS